MCLIIECNLSMLAKDIELDLKLKTIGDVVNSHRINNSLDLLISVLPYLTRGNREAIDDAICGKLHISN